MLPNLALWNLGLVYLHRQDDHHVESCDSHVIHYVHVGAGGGYNERDGVEYIERDDSDEEFDEVHYINLAIMGTSATFFLCVCSLGERRKSFVGNQVVKRRLRKRKTKETMVYPVFSTMKSLPLLSSLM